MRFCIVCVSLAHYQPWLSCTTVSPIALMICAIPIKALHTLVVKRALSWSHVLHTLIQEAYYMCVISIWSNNCDRIWEKGPLRVKRDFLPFFKLLPFQGHKSPGRLVWFISSLGLLLHRSKVRSYSNPPILSGESPKCGIKQRFSNAIDALTHLTHTGNGWGSEFLASVAGWLKNVHAKVQVHSCYGSRDISVLKWKFGNNAKWSLFSDPVIYGRQINEVRRVFCPKLIIKSGGFLFEINYV